MDYVKKTKTISHIENRRYFNVCKETN